MKKITILTLISLLYINFVKGQAPLFPNSIVSTNIDFIRATDPDAFVSVAYIGRERKEMPGNSNGNLIDQNAFIFEATFTNGKIVGIWCHSGFGNVNAARGYVDKLTPRLGKLPEFMRDEVNHVVIHNEDGGAFAEAGGKFFVLFALNMDTRISNNDLEETVFHESVHVSLDLAHINGAAWQQAQTNDGTFITDYAQSRPNKEDLAETAIFVYTMCKYPGRLASSTENWVTTNLPNRYSYINNNIFTNCNTGSAVPVSDFSFNVGACSQTVNFTDNSSETPNGWLWNFGDGNSSNQQNPSHTYATGGNYTVTLTASNANGQGNTASKTVTITLPPNAPTTTGDSICGAGTVNLSATGSDKLVWYDAAINGSVVNTGATYSPNLTNTTTFYVEQQTNYTVFGGPSDNSIGGGGNFTNDRWLIFNVLEASTLVSVKVYAQGTANRTIELVDANNNVLQTATVNIPNGEQRVQLNFPLPVGTGFILRVNGTVNLYRNNAGVNYPYSIGNLATITSSSAGNDFYYFFYNWEVEGVACSSNRTPVKGIINNGCVVDNCPNDPNKTEPGDCGCGVADTDSDNDGTADCNDNCPNDPNKTAAGDCGCGVADTDSDNDGTADCNDGCPNDPNKTAPGICGCGTPDTDSDNDGTPDCNDDCPNDPNKIAAGDCGCGVADTDSDNDGTADCNDDCPNDPNKTAAGDCGCGVVDTDSDNDGTADCNDDCPNDPNKTAPGDCGCGVADTDSDNDGTADCNDDCPNDPNKTAAGDCGCGVADTDSDNDGTADCNDDCPNDPNKTAPGDCGCGVADTDSDNDGTADCNDDCPNDPNKIAPGNCGCGNAELTPCTVGINELGDTDLITIYPNPTSGEVNITFNKIDNYALSVTDALGKVVLQKKVNGVNAYLLDLKQLENGVYLIEVSSKEFNGTYKVIKK